MSYFSTRMTLVDHSKDRYVLEHEGNNNFIVLGIGKEESLMLKHEHIRELIAGLRVLEAVLKEAGGSDE